MFAAARMLRTLSVLVTLAAVWATHGARSEPTHFVEGQLLVASPAMADPRFVQTVIFMIRHDATGAMGLVVNRQMGSSSAAEILREFGMDQSGTSGDSSELRVHYGGPVQLDVGFVLHSVDVLNKTTRIVNGDVGLTADIDMLKTISAGDGPRRRFFALGYAGWAPGQLEAELARSDWVTVPADDELVFGEDMESKWEQAMAKRMVDL